MCERGTRGRQRTHKFRVCAMVYGLSERQPYQMMAIKKCRLVAQPRVMSGFLADLVPDRAVPISQLLHVTGGLTRAPGSTIEP